MTELHGKHAGKIIGIYKITFPNGHYYIGQSHDIYRRKRQHEIDVKKGRHTNDRFQKCYDKYKIFDFELIEECTKDELNKKEEYYISISFNEEYCINLCMYAGSRRGVKINDISRQKISAAQYRLKHVKSVDLYGYYNNYLCQFSSIREAAREMDCDPKDISKSCKTNGKRMVAGHRFRFSINRDIIINRINTLIPI